MKHIGLYFGSFNPIHVGHLVIANAMLAYMDEVWFVVSPQNHFKQRGSLLEDAQRLAMVQAAVEGNPRLQACDIEFHLPTPSYTAVTLQALAQRSEDCRFSLIMGSDNLERFDRWRDYQYILAHHHLYVYPRPDHPATQWVGHEAVTWVRDCPLMEISSTYIRSQIAQGRSVQYLLTEPVGRYCREHRCYAESSLQE